MVVLQLSPSGLSLSWIRSIFLFPTEARTRLSQKSPFLTSTYVGLVWFFWNYCKNPLLSVLYMCSVTLHVYIAYSRELPLEKQKENRICYYELEQIY